MGCGASQENNNKKEEKKKDKDVKKSDKEAKNKDDKKDSEAKYVESVPGMGKSVTSYGALTFHNEDKAKKLLGVAIGYSPEGSSIFCLAYNDTVNSALYAGDFTEEQIAKLATDAGISGVEAVLKGFSSDFRSGKAKVSLKETADVVIYADKKKIIVPLTKLASPTIADTVKYVMCPLSMGAQKLAEKEKKDEKTCKQTRMTVCAAAVSTHAADADAKAIQIIRQEAFVAQTASGLSARKVQAVQRRLRRLQRGETGIELDLMYRDGGARHFAHLPQAEGNDPVTSDVSEAQTSVLDKIQAAFTGKNGAAEIAADGGYPIAGIMTTLQKIDEWDFDAVALNDVSEGNALLYTAYAMLCKLDLIQTNKLDEQPLRRFLVSLQAGHHSNAFHNSTRAADVAQANYYMLTTGGLIEKITLAKEEILAAIFAGIITDYDHPGFNNNFHIRTGSYLGTLYNDRSILEHHQLKSAFELWLHPSTNCLTDMARLSPQWTLFRDTLIEVGLTTDMGNHGRQYALFRGKMDGEWKSGKDWAACSKDDIRLALGMVLKLADMAHCTRSGELSDKWADKQTTEAHLQGDAEKAAHLTVSPYMDRERDDAAKGQVDFLTMIVQPLLADCVALLPGLEPINPIVQANMESRQKPAAVPAPAAE